MNCKEFMKSLDTYLEGELHTSDLQNFEQHFESCEKCKKELMSYEKCIRLINKFFQDKNPPGSLRKNVFEKCGCMDMKNTNCCPPESK
jgi:anti-sigma factor (TIGR02949 family)